MAWQNEMTSIVRGLINDIEGDVYPDSRIERIIVLGAQLLINRVDFPNVYTIDTDLLSLSPDPTTTSPKDNDFINLVSLQAAVIILKGEAKTLAAQAYRISDGPSSIDVTAAYTALQEQVKDMQELLDGAVIDYVAGNSTGGQAVLTPYTYATNQNRYYNGYYNNLR